MCDLAVDNFLPNNGFSFNPFRKSSTEYRFRVSSQSTVLEFRRSSIVSTINQDL